ncbi:MAG TPA: Asp-tRNA(Asn)/Glu-tRNA(Gln) amidotransferase subunit GatA [Thermoanaerobaculia bacterium]|nr:Asp-tRNA(Asn)/Glu-tRNA(Gln) amidotransferase subunit GatA [Thermoanaerobaculia bacterium]
MHELAAVPLAQFRERIVAGSLAPEAWLEASFAAIDASESEVYAFIELDRAAARRRFAASARGPLHGVPVAVKDNIVHRDGATTCGSRILEGFRSPYEATALRRLETAGAFILGKTNLDEFAMGSSTEHSAFGPTRNPLDPERVPGGSSGGSAAAVAAGMAPVALGSDTGGSVRQPAAFCGLVGLKPTWGRVSRRGLVAFASSLDQIGVFARRVADAAVILGVIAGHDPNDSTSSLEPVPDYAAALASGVGGKRFGIIAEALELLEGEARRRFEETIATLRGAGAEIETVTVATLPHAVAIYSILANAEASANLARFDGIRYGRCAGAETLEQLWLASRGEGLGPEVKRRIMLGTFALSAGYLEAYYGRAQRARATMRREIAAALERVDFLLTPTTPSTAFRLGEKIDDPLAMYLTDVFTVPANLAGIPALAIPAGRSEEGLPLSLQIMARPFAEEEMLAAGGWVEGVLG